uniref:Uncharacterized protein n=1 Tax=Aotus nancymaae TaxID=37293 RepID=A0A2K5E835_AOTNA
MRNSVVCPTRLLWRLSPSWGLATCKNLEGGAGEVVRGSYPRWLRTTGSTRILREDRAVQRHHRRSLRGASPRTRRDSSGLGPCSVAPRHAGRKRAALCARQSGHDPPVAWWLLGSRSAESGGPARSRVAAEHADPGASLICQSELETSAFPPSAPTNPRPVWHAGSGGRGGRGPSAEIASGYSGRRRALPGAADLREDRKLQLPEAAKLPGNVGK